MKRIKKISYLIAILPLVLHAQNDLSNDITVVKGYKPVLAEARKITSTPSADTASVSIPKLNYAIEPQPLAPSYAISPIKAVKIKDENIKKLYRGYLTAGYGFQNTFYGDLYYNALRSKEFNAGFHAKHLSSTGTISDYGFPGNSDNLVEAFGEKFLEKGSVGAKVAYERNVFHYYGYNADQTVYSKDDTKHTFNDINGSVYYNSLTINKDELSTKLGLDFYNFTDNQSMKENRFAIGTTLGKNLYNGYAHGDFKFAFTKFSEPLRDYNRSRLTFFPKYDFDYEPWKFTAGLNLEMEGETTTAFHFYPYLRFDYTLAEKAVLVYGEFTGFIADHNFRESSKINPFMEDTLYFQNTNNVYNFKFGTNITIDNMMHLNAFVNFAKLKDELFFVNNYTGISPVTFQPIYSDASLANVHGEFGYENNTKFNLWLKADYFGYTKLDSAVVKPWAVSPFQFTLSVNYNLSDKIILKTDWFIRSESNYQTYDANGVANGFGKIKPWGDINIAAEYRYSKLLSFYVNLNNLTFNKYQRWYNYPVYRFNALAGLTYSFK